MTSCGACPDVSICRDHGCQQEAWEQQFYQEQQQESEAYREAMIDQQCADEGHPYYGDDQDPDDHPEGLSSAAIIRGYMTCGRCYCGAKRYPQGGSSVWRVGHHPPRRIERVVVSERFL